MHPLDVAVGRGHRNIAHTDDAVLVEIESRILLIAKLALREDGRCSWSAHVLRHERRHVRIAHVSELSRVARVEGLDVLELRFGSHASKRVDVRSEPLCGLWNELNQARRFGIRVRRGRVEAAFEADDGRDVVRVDLELGADTDETPAKPIAGLGDARNIDDCTHASTDAPYRPEA